MLYTRWLLELEANNSSTDSIPNDYLFFDDPVEVYEPGAFVGMDKLKARVGA
jgi:hypothetical protein